MTVAEAMDRLRDAGFLGPPKWVVEPTDPHERADDVQVIYVGRSGVNPAKRVRVLGSLAGLVRETCGDWGHSRGAGYRA